MLPAHAFSNCRYPPNGCLLEPWKVKMRKRMGEQQQKPALLLQRIHDLSRVHEPVRIQCALDTPHHIDGVQTELFL
jgi:hypothetical protein